MMDYENLIAEFEKNLDSVQAQKEDILYAAEAGITQAERYLKRLRKEVVKKGFHTPKEEIHFFKHVKPRFFSKLIYYAKLFNIESKRPRGSVKSQIKYLNNEIKRLQSYFNENREFYHYYRRGSTTLDMLYFLRRNSDLKSATISLQFFFDEQFSTCQDSTVSTILAFDMLIDYLRAEIERLETTFKKRTNPNPNTIVMNKPTLSWTGSKTELIELIYALQSSGVINGGTADLKELSSMFEQVFNIDLGNYYHRFVEIRARKGDKTKFLNRLVEVLNNRIEDSDK